MATLKSRLGMLRELGMARASEISQKVVPSRADASIRTLPISRESDEERCGRIRAALAGWEEISSNVWTRTVETGFSTDTGNFDISMIEVDTPGETNTASERRKKAFREALNRYKHGEAEELVRPATFAPAESISFFDLETSGLSGGSGTVAFLSAIGFFEDNDFYVTQVFMDDYPGEPQFLELVVSLLSTRPFVVSYNGKAFDIPLLRSRCIINAKSMPELKHIDILPAARRFWKKSHGSCSLANLENAVLGIRREDDIPGAMIPRIWLDFVSGSGRDRGGAVSLEVILGEEAGSTVFQDENVVRKIAAHNVKDVVSTARLFHRILAIFKNAETNGKTQDADPVRIAEEFIAKNSFDAGISLLECATADGDNRAGLELSRIYHRIGRERERGDVLERLGDSVFICVERAKLFEHQWKDPARALESALKAVWILGREHEEGVVDKWRHDAIMRKLIIRISRLERKIGETSIASEGVSKLSACAHDATSSVHASDCQDAVIG
jgi:uncharacterized protein YprB with RNaseH-like and TPR domain